LVERDAARYVQRLDRRSHEEAPMERDPHTRDQAWDHGDDEVPRPDPDREEPISTTRGEGTEATGVAGADEVGATRVAGSQPRSPDRADPLPEVAAQDAEGDDGDDDG
jgi:hypothetical protein